MKSEQLLPAKLLLVSMQLSVVGIVLVFPAFLIYLFVFVLYSGESLNSQAASILPADVLCQSGEKLGKAGESIMRTGSGAELGFTYLMETPTNYNETLAWPVLVVFSPALSGGFMASYTGLTAPLTKAGFLIAYVDSVPINLKNIPRLMEVISSIDEHWCLDKTKIFVGGHSDGATISQALNFLPEAVEIKGVSNGKVPSEKMSSETMPSETMTSQKIKIAGFVSSAAGLQKRDLEEYACPEATQAMLLHNSGDDHFVNFGRGAAQWWAACNQCVLPAVKDDKGCERYEGCQEGGSVTFCEQPGSHLKWPERHEEIVDFLITG